MTNAHSDIVGGSTAKRVIACPGSVQLVRQMPPRPSSKYADEGTLCHRIMEAVLMDGRMPGEYLGDMLGEAMVTEDVLERKIAPALTALNEIDPDGRMEYECEVTVSFGDALPGVFGSTDMLGRIGKTAYVVDWKFGDGVDVEVEENPQALFYAAAAMRTPEAQWAFEGVDAVECVIVQPTARIPVKRWQTTPGRVLAFERELFAAVKEALGPKPTYSAGEHCRWCAAKPICPVLTGSVDRALRAKVVALDADDIGAALAKAELLEQWITELRALAQQMLEEGVAVPGFKLVPKRATRQWVDADAAKAALQNLGVEETELMETTMVSPAKAEKVLKKHKLALPGDLVVAVSSGNTLAPESDPRPAALQIGHQLTAALGKLV
jgi:hypothetical protein